MREFYSIDFRSVNNNKFNEIVKFIEKIPNREKRNKWIYQLLIFDILEINRELWLGNRLFLNRP